MPIPNCAQPVSQLGIGTYWELDIHIPAIWWTLGRTVISLVEKQFSVTVSTLNIQCYLI